jgi:hypothetical protein
MDADQHCVVLVKTYNIFKMQKLRFIKTQNIFYCLVGINTSLLGNQTNYCIVHCHTLEPSDFMTILNSKAQDDPILVEHIAQNCITERKLVHSRDI